MFILFVEIADAFKIHYSTINIHRHGETIGGAHESDIERNVIHLYFFRMTIFCSGVVVKYGRGMGPKNVYI